MLITIMLIKLHMYYTIHVHKNHLPDEIDRGRYSSRKT